MTDTMPPSTIAELRDVLIDFEANRPRTMQKELGPSELGTPCQQQIARKLAGAPRRPITEPTWAPFQGTQMHAGMEEVLRFWNSQLGRERWVIEDRLVISGAAAGGPSGINLPAIEGNSDAFDLDNDEVVDWKYVGTSAVDKLLTAKRMGKPPREQVSQEYRVQGHLYGFGQAAKGRTVRSVKLVLLARSWKYDDSAEWSEPYDERIALWAIERYYDVVGRVAELDLEHHPDQIIHIPESASNEACHWCPFHRPGQTTDFAGCRGHESEAARPVTDWLSSLPSSGAALAPVR